MRGKDKETLIQDLLVGQYEKYYRMAYSYVHSESDAQDIVQEAAYKAIYHAKKLKDPDFADTWICRIVINEAMNYIKKNKKTYVELEEVDVGREEDRSAMLERGLLYGAVTYASGRLGQEPVRSQGHIHAVSACGMSTPEVYEIWSGRAVIYMQERDTDDPGRCFAVYAEPGEVVIVPPGWAHATISADPEQPLTFGAWCVQDYGFVYDGVRAHGGMAYYPLLNEDGSLRWLRNEAYDAPEIILKRPEPYAQLGLEKGVSIYEQFRRDHDRFLFVPQPMRAKDVWEGFVP